MRVYVCVNVYKNIIFTFLHFRLKMLSLKLTVK